MQDVTKIVNDFVAQRKLGFTPKESFDRCFQRASDLHQHLTSLGVPARVVQVAGIKSGVPADAHPKWQRFKAHPGTVSHYVVETGGHVVDLSGSQFGQAHAKLIHKAPDFYANWAHQYPVEVKPLGKSQRDKDVTTVVSVAATKGGKVLFGLRRDTGKWNLPGGHLEPGETPEEGGIRELLEETGLKPKYGVLTELGFCDLKDGKLRVYSFMCEVEGDPDASKDPDEEMVGFAWVQPGKPPKSIIENLHNKKDVTLQFLGMQERDLDLIWDEDAPRQRELDELLAKGAMRRLAPFNPNAKQYRSHHRAIEVWQENEMGRERIPEMPPEARMRALHHLTAYAKTRRNPQTNEREFLLHRGMGDFEHEQSVTPAHVVHKDYSSWTPMRGTAFRFAGDYGGRVASAWIPESKIKSIPRQYDRNFGEYEVIVHPHESQRATSDDLKASVLRRHEEEIDDLEKATKTWRSKDGISIPVAGTPEREDWDQRYNQQLQQVFGAGARNELKPLTIDPNDESISGVNMAVNKDRLNLYTRMARAGEALPPVIVRRSGTGWVMVDGNHRQEAAKKAKLKQLSAYEIVPLQAPPKGKVRKAEDEPEPHDILAKMAKLSYATPEFEAWFQGSKIAHPDGSPRVVYHGTSKDVDFSTFKVGKRGVFFTTDPEDASRYAIQNDSQDIKHGVGPDGKFGFYHVNQSPRVFPVHLALKNPYRMTTDDLQAHKMAQNYARHQGEHFDKLRAQGYDGVDYGNGVYVAFRPDQIKSVHNNQPTSNKHILKAEEPPKPRRLSIDEIRQQIAARKARIKHLAETTSGSAWKSPNGGYRVVGGDPHKPGQWRVTRIEEDGTPSGHIEAATHEEALKELGNLVDGEPHKTMPLKSIQVKKFEDDLGEWLAKATQPEQFDRIRTAASPRGRLHVDHKVQMKLTPPSVAPGAELYHNRVVIDPSPADNGKLLKGVSPKTIFRVKVNPTDEYPARFMVKPYHEALGLDFTNWQKHSIQGWAEMANQGLYHAAGIGHLHQKVHVQEHNMGPGYEREPALVVHMEPGFQSVGNDDPFEVTPEMQQSARKIAVMDFLTNNLDRHIENLMVNPSENRLLAIDHGRSFQYIRPHDAKWEEPEDLWSEPKDSFGQYIQGSHDWFRMGIHKVDPYHNDKLASREFEESRRLKNYMPVFQWWKQVSPSVKAELERHLVALRDPKVREHIRENFMTRAKWLDDRARFGLENYDTTWHHADVPFLKIAPESQTSPELLARQDELNAALMAPSAPPAPQQSYEELSDVKTPPGAEERWGTISNDPIPGLSAKGNS